MGQYLSHLCGLRRDLSILTRDSKTLVSLSVRPSYTGLLSHNYPDRPGAQHGVGRGGGRQEGLRALRVSRALVHRCGVEGCESLVDYNSACQWAAKMGRDQFKAGDGCGSRSCSTKFNKAVYRKRQLERAADLRSGRKLLICRTKNRTCNLAYLCSSGWTLRAAERATAAANAL